MLAASLFSGLCFFARAAELNRPTLSPTGTRRAKVERAFTKAMHMVLYVQSPIFVELYNIFH